MTLPCECGCGLPAPIATRTDRRRGYVLGVPQRFRRGHMSATVRRLANTGKRRTLAQCSALGESRSGERNPFFGKRLSEDHRAKISASMLGERAPNWRGGITAESTAARHTREYHAWRSAVFARDDFTCQDCGARGVRLHAHHILPFATHPEFRTAIENGEALCKPCHRNRHREAATT